MGDRKYGHALVRCCDKCGEPQQEWPEGPDEPLLVFCRNCVDIGDIHVYEGYWTDGVLGERHEF